MSARHLCFLGLGLAGLAALMACATVPTVHVPAAPPAAVDTSAVPVPPPMPDPPVALTSRPRQPSVTVGLIWNADSLSLSAVGDVVVEGGVQGRCGVGGTLVIRRSGGGASVRVRGADSWHSAFGSGDTVWVGGVDPDPGIAVLRWSGRTWRGRMKVFLGPGGKLTLATRVPLETYLLGVLPAEIGPLAEDLLEAGRAQAIAARSFTLFYAGRRGVEGFDLFSTVEDQVYGPVEDERPLATRCVESTAGLVASHDGSPIRANYSSTCGGITADVWEAWPETPRLYLVSHRDRGPDGDFCVRSPHHRWHEEWSVTEFLANLRKFGPTFGVPWPAGGIGDLEDVEVTARSRSGRVWTLRVLGTRGEVVVPAHSLRRVLRRPGKPEAILRSTLFKVDVRRARGAVLAVVASGAGSGHGVGLCQTGALGMARQGRSGEAILEHYFPGVEIRRTGFR